MFSGIGIWEVLLIIVVILIVLGPQRVPEIVKKLGQAVRAIRRASTDLTTAVTRELDETQKSPSSTSKESRNHNSTPTASKNGTDNPDNEPKTPGEAPIEK